MSEIIGEGEARRFYEAAKAVPEGTSWIIQLDGRTVKTPGGETFLVPALELADAVASEWNQQGDKVIPASMPLTSLCNAAIDRIGPSREKFANQVVDYADSDLLCYWAEAPDDLVHRQYTVWKPVLDWAADEFGTPFETTAGIIPIEQPREALEAIRKVIQPISDYCLTGVVDLGGRLNSTLLAIAVWKRYLSANEAFHAAFLDEVFQEEQWGEDDEAIQRREGIREEINATARYLMLLD